jgi:alpha-glucosidase
MTMMLEQDGTGRLSDGASSPWWRNAVTYQVYVSAFADSNGDGIGDLAGVTARIPHLARLGVDALWLTPHYPSPGADGGYDISDHMDVHPEFGTIEDYDELIAVAHAAGLRVLIDIVPNHVSDQHPWFRDALAGVPGARDRFHFRPGRPAGPGGGGGGGGRTDAFRDKIESSGLYYLHLFSAQQPDLNWEHPDVRQHFDEVLRFWLDRGTDGVRIDVAAGLLKDPDLRDNPGSYTPGLFGHGPEQVHTWDQEGVHEIYRSWNQLLGQYPHQPASVGEVCLADLTATARYCRPDELGSAFTIELLKTDWGAASYARAIDGPLATFTAVGAKPAWVLSNHDKSRMVTRFGGGSVGRARARAAALLLLALPGQAYLYSGDELGLPDAHVPDHARRDPIFHRSGGGRLGRDGVRVPMPWTAHEPHCGFSTTQAELYLPQPDGWSDYAATHQWENVHSFLRLYAELLRLRRTSGVFGTAEHAQVSHEGDVLTVHLRGAAGRTGRCVLNMGEPSVTVADAGRLQALSDFDAWAFDGQLFLPGGSAAWMADLG